MSFKVDNNQSPLYGGYIITICLNNSLNKCESGDSDTSNTNRKLQSKTMSKYESTTINNNNDNNSITEIEIDNTFWDPLSTANDDTITTTITYNSDKKSKIINDKDIAFDNEQQQQQLTDEYLNRCGYRYFIEYEGSSVIHVVSTYTKSKDTLISIVPQHNKEEPLKITLYKAYRNKKAHKLNEYYNKIDRLTSTTDIQFEYMDDGISSIADEIVEHLSDIKLCYTKLSQFIDTKKESITLSVDCKLNLENRLHYLLRFHVDVQYSLGFIVVLDNENLNVEQFNNEKQILLSYLKENKFLALYKLFNQIYTLGENYELNMKVDILQNEPSFLFFSSFDNRDYNFIREYNNRLVSHSTPVQNNFLSIEQKICIITNIFAFPPLTTTISNNPDTITTDNDDMNINQHIGINYKKKNSASFESLLGIESKLSSQQYDVKNFKQKLQNKDNINDSTTITTNNDNNNNSTLDSSLSTVSTSINYSMDNKIIDNNINYSKNHTPRGSRDKQNFVTIKSSRIAYRADPSVQVNKTAIQKFYSTKFSKAEADIAHERYRPKVKSLVFDDSCFDEYSSKPDFFHPHILDRTCKSNNFLRDFLLKSCSASGDSRDAKSPNSTHIDDNDAITGDGSHSVVYDNQPYIQIDSNNKLTLDETLGLKTPHSKSATICQTISPNTNESSQLGCSASNVNYQNRKTQYKTQGNKASEKSSPKKRHGTYGHNDKLSPSNINGRDDTTIREFLDKEITHLDNDTSFKNNVAFKNQTKKSPKINLHFGIFKRDKVYSDISNNIRANKTKLKTKESNVQNTSHSPDTKPARLTSLKKFSTSSDIAISSKDNFNRSINCLFANNDMDMKTDANNSFLFDVDTWSNMVDPKILKKLGPRETKRQDVIYELIYTENQYLRTLKTLYQVMYKGLQNCVLIGVSTVDKLMPNLTSLIAINGRFLADLVAKQNADQNYVIPMISDVFDNQFSGSVGEYMAEIYAQVCLQKRSAVELYKELLKNNKEFNYFVAACANRPQLKRLTIPECIAFVTQRPLKYPILIQEILKNTKEDSAEHEGLNRALINARNVIKRMNTLVTEYENAAILEKIRKKLDPKLEWSYKDLVIKVDDIFPKSTKLVQSHSAVFRTKHRSYDITLVALWTHMVLLVEKDQKYVLLNSENPPIIPMQNLLLRTVATDKKAFFLVDKILANMYEIVCATVIDKTAWVDKINKHLKENSKDFSFTYDMSLIDSPKNE